MRTLKKPAVRTTAGFFHAHKAVRAERDRIGAV